MNIQPAFITQTIIINTPLVRRRLAAVASGGDEGS
jgi:hypothetical protein